jgi:hypothetical protein
MRFLLCLVCERSGYSVAAENGTDGGVDIVISWVVDIGEASADRSEEVTAGPTGRQQRRRVGQAHHLIVAEAERVFHDGGHTETMTKLASMITASTANAVSALRLN